MDFLDAIKVLVVPAATEGDVATTETWFAEMTALVVTFIPRWLADLESDCPAGAKHGLIALVEEMTTMQGISLIDAITGDNIPVYLSFGHYDAERKRVILNLFSGKTEGAKSLTHRVPPGEEAKGYLIFYLTDMRVGTVVMHKSWTYKPAEKLTAQEREEVANQF